MGAPPVDATGYVYENDVCVGPFDTFGRPANIANDGGYDPDKLGTYNVTYYSFQYKSMTVSVVEREKGDINSDGKCTIADAILLSRYTAEDEVNTARYAEPNGYRAFANLQNVFDYADYNGDGFINLLDVAQQLAIIAKLD